jgi:hypothetical protein
MAEEKSERLTCHTCMHKSHGNLLITVGIVAIVYAIVNYLRVTVGYAWPPYTGWAIGGLVLVIIGLIRGYWGRKCC